MKYKSIPLNLPFFILFFLTSFQVASTAQSLQNRITNQTNTKQITFQIKKTATIFGSVLTTSGEPISATVYCYRSATEQEFSIQTDTKGFYQFQNLESGTYNLWVNAAGFYTSDISQEVQITAPESALQVDFRLITLAKIIGKFSTGSLAVNLKNTLIEIWNFDYSTGSGALVDEKGNFDIRNVVPGRTEFQAVPPLESGLAPYVRRLYLNEGQTIENWQIELKTGARVSGQLRAASTSRFFNCLGMEVKRIPASELNPVFQPLDFVASALDENGNFQMILPPGNYRIQADQGLFCAMYIHFTTSPFDQELYIQNTEEKRLEPGPVIYYDEDVQTTISGKVTMPEIEAERLVRVFPEIKASLNRQDVWALEPLHFSFIHPDGTYNLRTLLPNQNYQVCLTAREELPLKGGEGYSVITSETCFLTQTATVDLSAQSTGNRACGRIEGDLDRADVIILVVGENGNLAGYQKICYALGDFDYGFKHLQQGKHTAYAFSSAHAEIPQCDFTVEAGKTVTIPTLSFRSTGIRATLPPVQFNLNGNYPNPFNAQTMIEFEISAPNKVCIAIYNSLGQLVRNVANQYFSTGKHRVAWNGKNNSGMEMSSGIYFYRLEVGDEGDVVSGKMVLMR
jgi:hypothetical protein